MPTGKIKSVTESMSRRGYRYVELSSEDAVKVIVAVAVPLAGTSAEGVLSEHEMTLLLGEQPIATVPAKPLTDVMVRLKLAEPPAFTVALVGEMAPLKSQTCSVVDALWESGLLVPVTVKV